MELFEHWESHMTKIVFYIIMLLFIAEILFAVALFTTGHNGHPLPEYVMLFIIRPLAFNLLVFAVWRWFYNKTENYVYRAVSSTMAITAILSCIMVVHAVFAACYAALLIPLFISLIYQNKHVTQLIFIVLQVTFWIDMGAIYLLRSIDGMPPDFIFNAVTAYIMLPFTYMLVRAMVVFEEKRLELHIKGFQDNERMKVEMRFDKLTQILNYNGLLEAMDKLEMDRDKTDNIHLAVIDLDHFKSINDDFGHNVGNIVLRRLGGILHENTTDDIIPARYGGEEFVILFHDMTLEEAYDKLSFIHQRFGNSTYDEIDRQITFSAGIATLQSDMTIEELFETADMALYRAKENGRDQIVIAAKAEA